MRTYVRHGKTRSPEYVAYRSAKYRCTNPTAHAWENYGGRGIEFKFASFDEFIHELGPRPSRRHCLDRINNDGHYEPGNVRWALPSMSALNRRQPQCIRANNSSGFRGVHRYKHSPRKPWKAQLRAHGKTVHLGLFASPLDAALAYDAAAQQILGPSAVLNFS